MKVTLKTGFGQTGMVAGGGQRCVQWVSQAKAVTVWRRALGIPFIRIIDERKCLKKCATCARSPDINPTNLCEICGTLCHHHRAYWSLLNYSLLCPLLDITNIVTKPNLKNGQFVTSAQDFLMNREFVCSKMGCCELYPVRPCKCISIYTVLALSYTAFIRKKQFFSECD